MTEVTATQVFSRPGRHACLEDFFDNIINSQEKNNNNNKDKKYQNDNIQKNQQEFGHKKRIKP